jgi:hypothetical protein
VHNSPFELQDVEEPVVYQPSFFEQSVHWQAPVSQFLEGSPLLKQAASEHWGGVEILLQQPRWHVSVAHGC